MPMIAKSGYLDPDFPARVGQAGADEFLSVKVVYA